MTSTTAAQERQNRQTRVGLGVWGAILMSLGSFFLLENLGVVQAPDSSRHPPSHAFDGKPKTRWSSEFRDPQWIGVDLGAAVDIGQVKLLWESAHAVSYEVQVSDDWKSFTTVKAVTEGDGGEDDVEVNARARYVRVLGTKRATQYGYSLFEFQVFDSAGTMVSEGRPARASSREASNAWARYWGLYWPLILIGFGLPPLIAPKDSGEQSWGLFLTGLGVFFQAQRLGLVSLRISQVWPVLLIGAGLLLVVQAIRQARSKPAGDEGGGSAGGAV